MAYSISTSLLGGSLTAKLEQAAEAGFSVIDINSLDIITSELTLMEIANRIESLGLRVGKFQPFYDLEGFAAAQQKHAFRLFEAYLNTAAELGAQTVLLGSNRDNNASDDEDKIVDDLIMAAEMAANNKLRIAYLALPWAKHITDPLSAYKVVTAVKHKAFGLALSAYFALADGTKPAHFRDIQGDKLFSVQLADAPRHDVDIRQFKHEFATLPGLGSLNLIDFIRIIAKSGYEGDWSLARMGRQEGLSADFARDGWRSLANIIDGARQNMGDVDFGVPIIAERDRAAGFEFLEFAVDEESGRELRQLLKSLCFRIERQHKSKAVQLWRQGAINIIVNEATEGFAHEALQTTGPGLCDMALRVGDAHRTVERARALDIKEIIQPVGSDELQIPAIRGVGFSILRFVDEKSNLHRLWDIDFNTIELKEPIQPAGLRRIDHLAQTMEQEKLNSWLLFYLACFNMDKSPLVDLTDPGGIVYSRAVESPEGEVRITLNGTSSPQKTFSSAFLSEHSAAGVQHIAFATDDIFETSQRLAETGFDRMVFPQHYYDDIALRYELDEDLVAQLREHQLLYSRSQKSEFFQLYSRPIWGGFFIEIVERRGGHKGYGAQNAPVRLAAQSRYLDAEKVLRGCD